MKIHTANLTTLVAFVVTKACLGNNNNLYHNYDIMNDESRARKLIAGGTPVDTPRKYKFFVRVNGRGCSGSLVAPNVVLSAANCEANSVTLGLHKLSLDEGEADEFYNIEHIPIVESVNHPEYKQFTNHWYDLSMMKLQWASQLYADYVVDLDKPDDEIELTIPGNELTILGFGLTGRGGDLPNVLQEGIVDVVPNDVCAASLGVAPDVLDTMFCAVRPGIDTCVGDFGGPVLAKVTQTDQSIRWKQVGVNSKFVRCVDFHGGPGVYASVSVGYPFISQYIAKWSDPTAAPPDTHPGCTDLGGFYDDLGSPCGLYAIGDYCATRGHMHSHAGLTANKACCVCGGGAPTTSDPTRKPTSKPTSKKPTFKPTTRKPTVKPSTRKPTATKKPVSKVPTRKPAALQL